MTIYTGVESMPAELAASVVCIGNFDGLHRGHQMLIAKTLELAQAFRCPSVVFTFDPHPLQVLLPEKDHKSLFSRKFLAEQLRRMHVDITIFQPFTKEFAANAPHDFVTYGLIKPLRPKAIVVGQNFNFGRGRTGSVGLLSQMGAQNGFQVDIISPVHINGEIVSSSRIRKAIQEGGVALAESLLGRPFSVEAPVISGAGRGRTIGVPTANMIIQNVILPKPGVYATMVEYENGEVVGSVSNLGTAPTFSNSGEIRLETHILDQKVDLTGTVLRVHFLSYLREERLFSDATELVAQIQRDITQARAVWLKRSEMGSSRS